MDNFFLVPPAGGTFHNLGSWLDLNVGRPDFDPAAVARAEFADHPGGDGGRLTSETSGIRTFRFPLMVPSGIDGHLIRAARPGAYVDLKLDGVASAESVRFDVVHGRWVPDYFVREHESGRSRGMLELGVQPFGYWPTMILLASAASIGGPGTLALNASAIVGDVSALAELFFAPTSATSYGDTQKTDSLFWSLGAAPSFQAWWRAASAVASGPAAGAVPTLLGDQFAPGSQAIRYLIASTAQGLAWDGWQPAAKWIIPPALEPAYRGEYRAFVWGRLGPSQLFPLNLSLDVRSGTLISHALASLAPVATLPVAVASTDAGAQPGAGGASPAFHLIDGGQLSLPPIASINHETTIRLWMKLATTQSGLAATVLFDIGGLYLQPLGNAGALPRGLLQPTWQSPSALGRLHISAVTQEAIIGAPTSSVASRIPLDDALRQYRGVMPLVGPSVTQLDLLLDGKEARAGAPTGRPPLRSEPHFAQVSVRYRPQFTFAKTL